MSTSQFEKRIQALQESYTYELAQAQKRSKMLMVVICLLIGLVIAALLPYNYLFPLKQIEPILVVVDNNGITQSITPYKGEEGANRIKQNTDLIKSYTWDYVNLRYAYEYRKNSDILISQYKRAALFSGDGIRNQFIEEVNQRNPNSPFTVLGEHGSIKITVDAINVMDNGKTVQVLFKTVTKEGAKSIVRSYTGTGEYDWNLYEGMTVEDKWLNPLGFRFISWSVNQNASNDVLLSSNVGVPLAPSNPASPTAESSQPAEASAAVF